MGARMTSYLTPFISSEVEGLGAAQRVSTALDTNGVEFSA